MTTIRDFDDSNDDCAADSDCDADFDDVDDDLEDVDDDCCDDDDLKLSQKSESVVELRSSTKLR